jgi:hypothetical protein
MQGEVTDMNTTLRSELAALQYKRDSLLMQVIDHKLTSIPRFITKLLYNMNFILAARYQDAA